jgi:hypothetical protein
MRVTVGREGAEIAISRSALRTVINSTDGDVPLSASRYVKYVPGDAILVRIKTLLSRSWGGSKLIVQGPDTDRPTEPDSALAKALARTHTWNRKLIDGIVPSINAITREEELSPGYVRRLLPLAFLSPDIVAAVLQGRQPPMLSLRRLTDGIPLLWSDQRRQFGFDA